MTLLPNKDPEEIKTVTFDYSLLLGNETISAVAVTIIVISGSDPNPDDVLNGAPTTSTPYVYQSIKNGLVGVTYKLRCRAETSGSQRHILAGQFEIQTA